MGVVEIRTGRRLPAKSSSECLRGKDDKGGATRGDEVLAVAVVWAHRCGGGEMGDLGGRSGDVGRDVGGDDAGDIDHKDPESSGPRAAAAALGEVHKGWTGLRFMTPGAADPPAT